MKCSFLIFISLITAVISQTIACDSSSALLQLNEPMNPISCTVTTGLTVTMYPELPSGLYFENNKIQGTPLEPYPRTIHYVTSRITSTAIEIGVYGKPTTITYGFEQVRLMKGLTFEPLIPVSNTILTEYVIDPVLPSGMLFNSTTGIISGVVPLNKSGSTTYIIRGTNQLGTVETSIKIFYISQTKVYSGITGCYLAYNTDCFNEEIPFYATQSYDICRTELSLNFTDNYVAGSGGHSWNGLNDKFNDYFTATFNGYLDIPSSSVYTFYLSNDAGAQVYIDNEIVIDHDGCTNKNDIITKDINLNQGLHYLRILYSEKDTLAALSLSISSSSLPQQIVSSSLLYQGSYPPSFLVYPSISGLIHSPIVKATPTSRGIITSYSVYPNLPAGITIDETTGEIYGTPSGVINGIYTITAVGPFGTCKASVSILIGNTPEPGLKAEYNQIITTMYACYLTSFNKGMLQQDIIRIDQNLNHEPENSLTVWEGLPPSYYQYFYSIYTGYIYLNIPGAWKIKAKSSDGSRIYIENRMVYNNWRCGQFDESTPGTIYIADTYYLPIRIEYFAILGTHGLSLYISSPSDSTYNLLTEVNLFHAPTETFTYIYTKALYYKDTTITANTPIFFVQKPQNNHDYIYSITPTLPDGLDIDVNTGKISGTPSVLSGLLKYTVICKDLTDNSIISTVISIRIISVIPPSNLVYKQGTVIATDIIYSYYVTISTSLRLKPTLTGTASYYTISPDLPTGITISETSGQILGKPTKSIERTQYTVTVHNAGGIATYSFYLTVPSCIYNSYINLQLTKGTMFYELYDQQDNLLIYQNTTAVSTLGVGVCVNLTDINALNIKIGCRSTTGCAITIGREDGYIYTTIPSIPAGSTSVPSWNTYPISLQLLPPTAITLSRDSIVAFIKTPLPAVTIAVTGQYNSIIITPSLPATMAYNHEDHTISGEFWVADVYEYTITAKNDAGETSTTLTFTIQDCASPKQLFILTKKTLASGNEESFSIYSTPANQMLYTSPSYGDDSIYSDSICVIPTDMIVKMKDVQGNGWADGAYLTVKDSGDGQMPTMSASSTSVSSFDVFIDVVYDIDDSNTWNIWNSKEDPVANWNIMNLDTNNDWEHKNTNWGIFASTTIYLQMKFDLSNINRYPLFEMNFLIKEGVIIYMNGERVYTENMPATTTITSSTLATNTYQNYIERKVSISGSYLKEGVNYLAIEIHQSTLTNKNNQLRFTMKAQVVTGVTMQQGVLGTQCVKRTINGIITDSESYNMQYYDAERAFDGIYNTTWLETVRNGYIQFQFPYGQREYINKVRLYINPNNRGNAPVSFKLYGINDIYITELLSVNDNNLWNEENKEKNYIEYDLIESMNTYNAYKLTIDGVNGGDAIELSEIEYYTCQRTFCSSIDNYPSVYSNEYSTKECSSDPNDLIVGDKKRQCGEGLFPQFLQEESNCYEASSSAQQYSFYLHYIFNNMDITSVDDNTLQEAMNKAINTCAQRFTINNIQLFSKNIYPNKKYIQSGVWVVIETPKESGTTAINYFQQVTCLKTQLNAYNNKIFTSDMTLSIGKIKLV
ncbi:hypothetical protein WA158_003294 [Blastocystis sp. Blastoise]